MNAGVEGHASLAGRYAERVLEAANGAAVLRLGKIPRVGLNSVASVLRRRSPDEQLLVTLRRRDETAFAELVDRHHASLVRVAATYVRDRSIAEEVAQETWLIVLEGLDGFQGRSSLKTWIFSILINRAKTRGERERRQVPFSSLAATEASTVAADRFLPPDDPQRPLGWSRPPRQWPEERLLTRETVQHVREAVSSLPPAQQIVLGLRDVEGWTATEVCHALKISAVNERVLLHRARAHVRRELETYFDPQ